MDTGDEGFHIDCLKGGEVIRHGIFLSNSPYLSWQQSENAIILTVDYPDISDNKHYFLPGVPHFFALALHDMYSIWK